MREPVRPGIGKMPEMTPRRRGHFDERRSVVGRAADILTIVANKVVLPDSRFDVACFGELVSDPSRVTMLLSLMDGRARPATELARLAGIEPQTASTHLQRILAGGLIRVEPQGRHRFYRLASGLKASARFSRPCHC